MVTLVRHQPLLIVGIVALLSLPGCSDYGPGSPGSSQYVAAQRKNAEETLREAGAQMEVQDYGIGKAWKINLNGKEFNDDLVEAILGLPYVSEVRVAGTSITNEQLTRIGEGKGYWLLVIDVSDTQIGNEGIAFIKTLKHLTELNISGSQITPEYLDGLLKERAAEADVRTKKVKLTK